MSSNVLIIGKVNHNNFGDILMVVMTASYVEKAGKTAYVLEAEDFLVEQASKYGISVVPVKFEELDSVNFTYAIYTGGGYFAHGLFNGSNWCSKWMQDGYFIKADSYLNKKKIPYSLYSIEVGPVKSKEMQAVLSRILSGSRKTYLRNKESVDFAKNTLNISNVEVGPDMVLTDLRNFLGKDLCVPKDSKKLVVGIHVTDKYTESNFFKKIFLNDIIETINEQDDISEVILFSDNEETSSLNASFANLLNRIKHPTSSYRYEDTKELIDEVQKTTHVITTKLHVGVTAIALNKHVLCLSDTPKSKRFYNSLEAKNRRSNFYLDLPWKGRKIKEFLSRSKMDSYSNLGPAGFYSEKIMVEVK